MYPELVMVRSDYHEMEYLHRLTHQDECRSTLTTSGAIYAKMMHSPYLTLSSFVTS